MEEKEKHERIKKKLKAIGGILLAAGIIFALVGFINFISSFSSMEPPTLFWCLFIGFPMLAGGSGLLLMAYKGSFMRYFKNEAMPIVKDSAKELEPTITDLASAVSQGIKKSQPENFDCIICTCGEKNSDGSKFCSRCGKTLRHRCPSCGAEIESNSNFCNKCGSRLK